MKHIVNIILVLLIVLLIGTVALSLQNTVVPDEPPDPPEPTIYYEPGTKIIDRRFTQPDIYELLYRTTFENGFGVEQWREVSREEYEEARNE